MDGAPRCRGDLATSGGFSAAGAGGEDVAVPVVSSAGCSVFGGSTGAAAGADAAGGFAATLGAGGLAAAGARVRGGCGLPLCGLA